jgi:hypothetical protein
MKNYSFAPNPIRMNRRLLLVFLMVSSAVFYTSCGSGTDRVGVEHPQNSDTVKSTADELTQFKYDLTISNIPIPFDILGSLTKSGVSVKTDLLNKPANVSKYSQNNIKAVNLGIYGADMAYVISFEQYQELASFLKSTKKLADDLGIPIAFDQRALTSFEKFKDNKDTLEKLVFDSYAEVDKTLKSNERIGLASLVVTGGWLEGLHTSISTLNGAAKDDANKSLYSKISEQRVHLVQIIDLLSQFKSEAFYANLITDLEGIRSFYDGLGSKTEITTAEVQALGKKVEELRSKMVNG